jgi:hypothetical protein
MSQGANVRSVEAIKDFKIALINYAEEAHNALGSVEMEIRMIRNWLLRDQLTYWQSQIKRGQERVSMARTELHRRQLSQSNSDAISDTEQREALREAQRKLREAEEKVITIKRWVPVLEHTISEYHSHSQPLGDRLSGGFQSTLNLLDRMLDALDSYLSMAPPTTPVAPPPPRTYDETPAGERRTAGAAETVSEPADEKKAEPATAPADTQEQEAPAATEPEAVTRGAQP